MKYQFPILLLITALFFACGKKEEQVVEETPRPVRYGTIKTEGHAFDQVFSGSAQSSMEAKLSFRVSGSITNLAVKVGDRVGTGQLIATLDATDYTVQQEQAVANLRSAETQIKSAEAQLVNARSAYRRVEKLYENNSVSLSEFEQAKSAYEAAEAQFTAAKAQAVAAGRQAQSAQNQVTYARLTAPFAGVITMVNVEENELVGSGTPIAALSALTQPEVRVGMPESFITQISKGQKVDIEFSTLPGKTFTGTVSEVSFSATASTYPVIISIDKPTKDIRPGMAANVRFPFNMAEHQDHEHMVAPVASIGEGTEGHFVFKLEKDGEAYRVKKSPVTIGDLTNAGFEISEGLEPGDLVATAGLNSLLDGMRVTLME